MKRQGRNRNQMLLLIRQMPRQKQKKCNRTIKLAMTLQQRTVATGLTKRVRDVAELDFICLPEDTLVGEAVKAMRNRDVSSILVSKLDRRGPRPHDTPSFIQSSQRQN